jgi:hypothetical protein
MNPKLLFAAIPAALALVAAARAAESPLDALFACQKISDGAARLTCLDREVAALRGETKSGQVVAVDPKKLEEDSYGFDRPGVPLPAPQSKHVATAEPAASSTGAPPAAGAPAATGAPAVTGAPASAGAPPASAAERRIVRDKDGRIGGMGNLAVAGIDKTPYGQLIVKLQNGQVWVQTDRIQLFIPRRTPQEQLTVSISSAALGSYKMQLNGDGPWVRARRAN